ncbi:MAG TPA: tetratricopeptide repeat protein [Gammaproteobacteria bacterium]
MPRYVKLASLAWLACTAAAGTASAAPIEGDASDRFTAGSDAFAEGDYATAAEAFQAARAAGMTGPAVEYNIGVSYYRLGDFERAEEAFRTLAAEYPDMRALAQYNLGLSLTRQNRIAEARAAFEQARTSDDPTLAALAEAMLRRSATAGEPLPEPERWVRLLDFALGYDDNVALVEESSLPAGLSTSSPLLEGFGLLSGRLGDEVPVRLDASAYLVRYSDAPEFDQDGLRVGVAYLWDWADWRMDAGPYYNYSGLDGQGFEQRIGASLNARYPINDLASLSIRFIHDDVGELSSAYDFVNGTRDRISIGFERLQDRGRVELGYVHERNDRDGPGVSPTRHEVFAGYEHALNADWSVEVEGLLRMSTYDELAEPRDEDFSQLSLTATRDFQSGWQLLGQYRVADNASNVDTFSYDRNRVIFSLNRLF